MAFPLDSLFFEGWSMTGHPSEKILCFLFSMETVFANAKFMVLGLDRNQFVRASGRDKNSVRLSS